MPQSFVPFAEPYTPNLVPQAVLGGDPTAQLADLERFLAEEFERIQQALVFVPVQAAYCSLIASNAANQPLGAVAQVLTCWSAFLPLRPNRVIPAIDPDFMIVEEGGVYFIQAFLTCTVETNTEYIIRAAVNGVALPLFGVIASGNQADIATVVLFGLVELNAGSSITILGEATGVGQEPYDFTVDVGTFACIRVSELHGRNASAIP